MDTVMKEVLPGIRAWPFWAERVGYNFYGTFIPEAGVIIDPVEPSPEVLKELEELQGHTIVLTNRNHYRAAAKVKAKTGARVLVHPDDAGFVSGKGVDVDGFLQLGQAVGPFIPLDASGKSPGEVALYWPQRHLLVVGDACVCKTAGQLALLPDAVMDDPARLHRSLRRIADDVEIDFDTILCGDGEPILTNARAALRALCASFPE